MAKIILAGGSGFIGDHLTRYFSQKGFEIVILTRKKTESENTKIKFVNWDAKKISTWVNALENADLLINLTGKSINCRHTLKNREEILASRVESTKVLGQALAKVKSPPKLWINASAATIYRDDKDRPMDEQTGEIGKDFFAQVAKDWEQSLFESKIPENIRRVALRISIVLGPDGGAFPAYYNLAKFYLGGTQGSGKQMISWIHVKDAVRAIEFIFEHPQISGPLNLASPGPLLNQEFMKILREHYHKSFGLPAYSWMVKMGAIFLGTEPELLLKSSWVFPRKLLDAGFKFQYANLKEALKDL